jgi:capsular polysaccharide export protein
VVTGVSLPSLLPAVDRVETFSSLAGFEALLRGVPVSVYGMPFYAGWGLTQDLTEAPRRRKGIELEALVHAAYVAYPFCVDPLTLLPCPPEFLAERLVHLRASRRHRLVQELRQKISWLGRRLGL